MKSTKIWYVLTLVVLAMTALVGVGIILLSVVRLDVLDDNSWKLTTDKNEYMIGETIITTNEVNKLREVNGERSSYVTCTTASGSNNRYAAGEGQGNSRPGMNKREIALVVPEIPDTPRTCFVELSVDYGYPYKLENKRSQDFTVKPKEDTQTEDSPSVTTEENDNVVVENAPRTPQITVQPSAPTAREIIVPMAEPTPVPESSPQRTEEPNIILRGLNRTVDGIIDVVNGII